MLMFSATISSSWFSRRPADSGFGQQSAASHWYTASMTTENNIGLMNVQANVMFVGDQSNVAKFNGHTLRCIFP